MAKKRCGGGRRKTGHSEGIKIHGIFRVQLTEKGRVVGDSGWRKNLVTDTGFQHYLVENLMAGANSKRVTHMSIGTGTEPGAAHTTMEGEMASRVTVSTNAATTKTAQMTAQFASSVFSTQGPKTIKNIGLFNTSSAGTLFAGSTYATSQWNTNQDLNATYQIRFS